MRFVLNGGRKSSSCSRASEHPSFLTAANRSAFSAFSGRTRHCTTAADVAGQHGFSRRLSRRLLHCPCRSLAGLCMAGRSLRFAGPGRFRLRGFRLGIRRSRRGCRHLPRHTPGRTCLNLWRRPDHPLVVCRPLGVANGVAGRRQPWPRLGVHRLPWARGPARALLAQLPRGVVLGQAPALRVHPGIHFVLSAHMRNLSNAPTPPTSANSDASSMNLMREAVCCARVINSSDSLS